MSALFTAEQNLRDVFLLAHYTDDLLNQAAAGAVKCIFRCPVPCTILRLDASYVAEAGTTPALTVSLRRVTTAILVSAVTTDVTAVYDTAVETSQSLTCDAGEALNLFVATANDDNDFTGISVQVWATRR